MCSWLKKIGARCYREPPPPPPPHRHPPTDEVAELWTVFHEHYSSPHQSSDMLCCISLDMLDHLRFAYKDCTLCNSGDFLRLSIFAFKKSQSEFPWAPICLFLTYETHGLTFLKLLRPPLGVKMPLSRLNSGGLNKLSRTLTYPWLLYMKVFFVCYYMIDELTLSVTCCHRSAHIGSHPYKYMFTLQLQQDWLSPKHADFLMVAP